MNPTEVLRAAALGYARQGLAVIPLRNVTPDGSCSCPRGKICPTPGKHPIHGDWPNRGSRSAADIYEWWEQYPHANVGIVTGSASGVWVLDVDPAKGGLASLLSLLDEHGKLPETRKHKSGAEGLHLFFRVPEGARIPTTAGSLGQGLDTRGEGNGMVVAPPSTSSAGAYTVLTGGDVAEAPAWLLDRLAEIQRRREVGRDTPPVTGEPIDESSLPTRLRDRLADLGVADRSAHFHGTVAACRRAKLTQGQTVTLLSHWCSAIGKYAGRVEAEVARSWGKLEDADPTSGTEAWVEGLAEAGEIEPLRELVALARAYQDLPDPGHIFLSLAVAVTRDLDDEPVWLLIVAPPSSGKTETTRGLSACVDAHLDDVTMGGLLSWKPGRNPRPVGLLTQIGDRPGLVTFGDLSTLLATSDRGGRDTTFAALRRIYDGHYTRNLGTLPQTLEWKGKLTVIGAVTGAIDNYSAHADALGARWLYVRLPKRSQDAKRKAALLARHGAIRAAREAYAAKTAQVLYSARSQLDSVDIPEALRDDIEDAAIVTCSGRATVPRNGYGAREIDGAPVVEEPPRLVRQLTGLARGLLALSLPAEYVGALIRRVCIDSMPAARAAVLRALTEADGAQATAPIARAADLDRHVARRNLEELELIGVLAAVRRGEEPNDHEVDRRACLWSFSGEDGELVRKIFSRAKDDIENRWTEKGRQPSTPPRKKGERGCASPFSVHPNQQVGSGFRAEREA